ncbi:MAG: GAF domain-containing protein [Anaerolineae bacterium]|nr:GAF domain-containing protein [Anaerolineae bacterium]
MAKKRKDLSGQLDGLFADFESEEEVEAKKELEKPQVIDELVEGEPAELAEQAEPAAEQAQPVAEQAEMPAIDALLAAEPAAEAAEEGGQALPALAESALALPVLTEEPAIDALLAAEPAELPEEAPPVEELLAVEEAEPAEVPEPAVIEEVEAEPELLEAVEPEFIVAEPVEPMLVEEAELVVPEFAAAEPVAGLPTMAELLAAEQAEPAQIEPEISEPVELPTLAELLAAEEAAPAVSAEVEPEIPEPVAAEVAVEPGEPVEVEQEAVAPVPPSAPPDWAVTIREQRTRILNNLLLLVFGAATLVVASLVIFSRDDPGKWWSYLPYFVAWAVLVGITFARRLDPMWRTVGLVVLAYVVGVVNLYLDGPLGAGWLYLLLAPLLLSTLIGRQAGIYAALASFCVYLVFSVVYYALGMEPAVVTLLQENWTWTTVLLNMSGTFGLILAAATMIQWMFNSSLATFLREAEGKHAEVVRSREALRERAEELAAANVALRKRSLQLETASQVSRAASSELDPDELMQHVVDLIRERFDLYYVGLFLISEASAGNGAGASQHELVLRAGTGVAGRWMLAQSYSVEIGDDSAVGQCTARGHAQTTLKLDEEGVGFAGDLLPQTRSEIALPLRSRGRVLGALDVHSVRSEAFSQEDIAVLQTMADQIAVTIDNAHLFAELRKRLQEMEASQRLYVREQWTDLAPRRISPLYERAQPDAAPLTDAALSEVGEVALRREMVVKLGGGEGAGEAALVTPITLRGQVIGALGLQETAGRRQWAEDEIALIEAVADQMALAIENVRLLEETRQLAGWEQTLSDITARFSRSLDTETLLQTAIQELGDLLQVDEVSVHIGPSAELASAGDEETA